VTLSVNWIGVEGATAIAGAIKGLTAMVKLFLGSIRGWGEVE
jgi:hypothetical protein